MFLTIPLSPRPKGIECTSKRRVCYTERSEVSDIKLEAISKTNCIKLWMSFPHVFWRESNIMDPRQKHSANGHVVGVTALFLRWPLDSYSSPPWAQSQNNSTFCNIYNKMLRHLKKSLPQRGPLGTRSEATKFRSLNPALGGTLKAGQSF
jgi:hypothetical protein